MKKSLIALLLFPTTVFATGGGHETNNKPASSFTATQVTGVNVGVKSDASSFSKSSSTALGGTGIGTGYGQGGSAVNEGNQVNINNPGQAPTIVPSGLVASTGVWNTCLGSVSESASWLTAGESVATTVQVQICIAAQLAMLSKQIGLNPLVAKELLCSDPNFNFVYDVLAKHGLDSRCLAGPSSNYVTPGGSNPHYREIRNDVVIEKQAVQPVKTDLTVFDKMDAIADEQIRRLAKHKRR